MTKRSVVVALVAIGMGVMVTGHPGMAAESATPAPGCAVEPLDSAPMAAISAAATGSPVAVAEPAWPGEAPTVDDATLAAIDAVLQQEAACAAAGDPARLFALYTPRFAASLLLPNASPIAPATPGAEPARQGTPTTTDQAPLLLDARLGDDGAAIALVTTREPGGPVRLVRLVREGDRWLIDGAGPAPVEGTAVAIEPAMEAAAALAVTEGARIAGVPEMEVTITRIDPTTWPNAALGCPEPGMAYAEALTDGYIVVVEAGGTAIEVHTDAGSRAVTCDG